jgi:LPXTG-motif cell wall-anchored protein
MLFLLGSGQALASGISTFDNSGDGLPAWLLTAQDDQDELPDWLVIADDNFELVSLPDDALFEIKNMSPGDKKTTTIKVLSQCTFPFHLIMEVYCANGVEIGINNFGTQVPVVLAQQLTMKTFVDGVEIESPGGQSFPNNSALTPSSFSPPFNAPGPGGNVVGSMDAGLGLLIDKHEFTEIIEPGSITEIKVDIELDGPSTGNEYQNTSAQFKWVFKAQALPPGEEEKEKEKEKEKIIDKSNDNDKNDKNPPRPSTTPTPPINISSTGTPGGNLTNIPEPPNVTIQEEDPPLISFMPKTGEPSLWYSLAPGLLLILSGMALLLRKKDPAPQIN